MSDAKQIIIDQKTGGRKITFDPSDFKALLPSYSNQYTSEAAVFNRMDSGAMDAQRYSYLGTPIFCDLTLYPDKGKGEPFVFDVVLVEVSMTKNIIKTAVAGRNGTFKEYISDGDYEVKIMGAFMGIDKYPLADMRRFHDLLKEPQAIKVVSEFLRIFDIYNIVIESYSFPQQVGKQKTQVFELGCCSDKDEVLIENIREPITYNG